jgi:hypothetical protein
MRAARQRRVSRTLVHRQRPRGWAHVTCDGGRRRPPRPRRPSSPAISSQPSARGGGYASLCTALVFVAHRSGSRAAALAASPPDEAVSARPGGKAAPTIRSIGVGPGVSSLPGRASAARPRSPARRAASWVQWPSSRVQQYRDQPPDPGGGSSDRPLDTGRGGSAVQRQGPPCRGLTSTLRRRQDPPCGRWADAALRCILPCTMLDPIVGAALLPVRPWALRPFREVG